MQHKKSSDPLFTLQLQVKREIEKNHLTIEQFCFENDIAKSILSRLISGKQTEFKMKTLVRIAKALGKKVEVKLK